MNKIRLFRRLRKVLAPGVVPRFTVPDGGKAPAHEGKRCYGYGLFPLVDDGLVKSRWSRRFFGFYLSEPNVHTVRLRVRAFWPVRLTGKLNGAVILDQALVLGENWIDIQIPETVASTMIRLDFVQSTTWALLTKQGKCRVGVQLLALWAFTTTKAFEFPITDWHLNPVKDELREQRLFVSAAVEGASTKVPAEQNGLLNQQERARGCSRVESLPLKLYLEITLLCNLRCPSCFQAYATSEERSSGIHFMSPFLFETIRQTLFPGALMVWYNGNGESLLHPAIAAILKSAQDHSFIPALLTNGTRFNQENMRLLVEGGFFVTISVDSPYEADFERLRKGAKFSKLVSAIVYMQGLKARLKRDRFNLRIQCVAQQSNLDQLCDLVQWAASYGISEVQFLPLHNFGMPYAYLERAKLYHTPEKANTEMLKAIRIGTQLGLRVRPFPPISADDAFLDAWQAAVFENVCKRTPMDWYFQQAQYLAEHPANNTDRRCHMAWSECFLGVDGAVAPCDLELSETTMGNLYDDDFWSIWNGAGMSTMRETVNNEPLGLCQHGTCIFRPARSSLAEIAP